MIDQFIIDGEPVLVSHRATQVPLTGSPPVGFIPTQLAQYGVHYYVLTDNNLFIDADRAVSIAAQIGDWPNDGARTGEHHVFIPGDKTVYHAHINIKPSFVIVLRERFIDFREAMEIILKNPLNAMIHHSGRLAGAFTQQGISVTDLEIDFSDSRTNPYRLRYGLNRRQLILVPAGLALLAALGIAAPALISQLTGSTSPAPADSVQPPSTGADRLSTDLMALSRMMKTNALLGLHGMRRMTVTAAARAYDIRYSGEVRPESTLGRLRNMAYVRNAEFTYAGQDWSMTNRWPRAADYRTFELPDLYHQLDLWRVSAARHNFALSFDREEILHDASRYRLNVTMQRPHPAQLTVLARDLRRLGLAGVLDNATFTTASDRAHTWTSLRFQFTVTGYKP